MAGLLVVVGGRDEIVAGIIIVGILYNLKNEMKAV